MKIIIIALLFLSFFLVHAQQTNKDIYAFSKATINGDYENIKISKSELVNVKIGILGKENKVIQFKIKVPNQKSYLVFGNKFDKKALSMIKQTKNGRLVVLYNIRYKDGITDNGLVNNISFTIE